MKTVTIAVFTIAAFTIAVFTIAVFTIAFFTRAVSIIAVFIPRRVDSRARCTLWKIRRPSSGG